MRSPRALLASSIFLAVACGPAPRLSEIKTGVFDKKCSTAGCHQGSAAAQGLNLEGNPHSKLVNVASTMVPGKKLVVPGDVAASFLVEKMEKDAPAAGTRMPPAPPFATAAELDQVKAWISAGAPND